MDSWKTDCEALETCDQVGYKCLGELRRHFFMIVVCHMRPLFFCRNLFIVSKLGSLMLFLPFLASLTFLLSPCSLRRPFRLSQISLLLILIPRSELALGQASFLILIGALLSPPNEPLAAILRREFNILFAVLVSWAWSCLGMKLAFLARSKDFGTINQALIFEGAYIEFGVRR